MPNKSLLFKVSISDPYTYIATTESEISLQTLLLVSIVPAGGITVICSVLVICVCCVSCFLVRRIRHLNELEDRHRGVPLPAMEIFPNPAVAEDPPPDPPAGDDPPPPPPDPPPDPPAAAGDPPGDPPAGEGNGVGPRGELGQ